MYYYQALQNENGPYFIFCQIYVLNTKDFYWSTVTLEPVI